MCIFTPSPSIKKQNAENRPGSLRFALLWMIVKEDIRNQGVYSP